MLFTDVMTIYNHYIDTNGNDAWKRTVIKGVQWRHSKLFNKVTGTELTEERAESITIDMSREYLNGIYVTPKEFKNLQNNNGYWTVDEKDGLDVVVLGEITQEISASYPLKNLHRDYQYVGTVRSVADNTNRTFLPNLKVVAH